MNALVLILAAALSAGNAEFDRTAAEGAARITLQRVKDELKVNGPAAGTLKKAMLADPGAFISRGEAMKACRVIYADAAQKAFAERLESVRDRLELEEGFKIEFTDADREASVSNFAAVFERERSEACAEQAGNLVSATRPSEADFDTRPDHELRDEMLERIVRKQKSPVFQENRQFISERMIEPVLADARREQRRQAEYLMRARCDTFAPSKLAADLRKRLEENVEERRGKADDPQKAWGVFEGTFRRSVDSAVERRTVERLVKKIELAEIEVEIEKIRKVIAEEPSAHVKVAESEKIFADRYAVGMVASALDKVRIDAPPAERDETGEYLSARLHDGRIRNTVSAKVKKEVLPKWREVRAQVAAVQFSETWPALADGTWSPEPALADRVAARSDYKESLRKWRKFSELAEFAAAENGGRVLEEASRKADKAVAAAFDCARSAITAQNAIVDGSHESVLAESRRRKDSFWTRTPDLEAVIRLLTEATEAEWSRTRIATLWPEAEDRPANADSQHRDLFPSVKRKIELLAKVILEEMKEPEPEEEKPPPEEPPEEETPEETPEDPEEIMEFSITVKRQAGSIEVSLEQGGETLVSENVKDKRDDFENAMFKVTQALSGAMKLK